MADELTESAALWDSHARRDPLWAILSDPDKRGGKWDVRRFFQTGVGEVSWLLYQLRARDVAVSRESALDFGCGVGRLTQALAPHFDRVVGVDVSPRMIALAGDLNRFPERASYFFNCDPHLATFPNACFDFILSNLVLQHIRPDLTVGYLGEFFRVLRPGGILIFQLPSHRRRSDDPPLTPALRAMPDEAYRAALRVAGIPSQAVVPGSPLVLSVCVRNASVFQWSLHESGVMRVGNHWLDSGGTLLLADDARASLPAVVLPGEQIEVSLTVTAPAEDGDYLCAIDLAHEGVVWFREKGSREERFAIRVRRDQAEWTGEAALAIGPAARAQSPSSEAPPIALPLQSIESGTSEEPEAFPMYGLQKDRVLDLIATHGAHIIHVEDDRSCGDDWISYRYFVRTTR